MTYIPIEDFPGYSVNESGQIRNDRTNRDMALTVNQYGVLQVGMMRDGRQHKRGVALIVARTFLDPPHPETFDTPIHLNGDKTDNHVYNLMWRPRWFAIKYQQCIETSPPDPLIKKRLMEKSTHAKFKNSRVVAREFGLIEMEIVSAIINRTYVWPTYQTFVILE